MNLLNDQVYIIAEAGVNHNGSYDLAQQLVEAAAASGADAVKFQTFKAMKLATTAAEKAQYQKKTTDADESQQAMLAKLELPEAWHVDLQALAHRLNMEFLSTAFDTHSLDFLNTLALPFYKIPSGELTNAPLLWRFARTQKPLIVSTGMATLSEVEQALAMINHGFQHRQEPKHFDEVWGEWSNELSREFLKKQVTLLHCTSQYPTPWNEVNLRAMDTLKNAFGLQVGYSDHTAGTMIPIAAVARGAKVIEKHLTLDNKLPGPDHKASLEPLEFKKMVEAIRALEQALGDGIKAPQKSEIDIRKNVRQSIVAARQIPQDKVIESEDLTTARTGQGISATAWWNLIGQTTDKAYEVGDLIKF